MKRMSIITLQERVEDSFGINLHTRHKSDFTEALEDLSEPQGDVIELACLKGFTEEQIQADLKLSSHEVQHAAHNGFYSLRGMLDECGNRKSELMGAENQG